LKFKSLKTKVLIWFGGITFFILIIFNIAFYHFLEQNIKLSIQNKLYNKAVFINDNILKNTPIQKLLKYKQLETCDIAVVKDNKIIYKKGNIDFKRLLGFIEEKKSFFVFKRDRRNLDGLYIFRIHTPFKGAILFYEEGIDTEINNKLQEVKNTLFVLEPVLLILLIFVANKLITKILKPIAKITKTANTISVTDLTQRIEQPLEDNEIKELVDSFNNMLSRLNNGIKYLEQFNSDVSHELKTPLTVIKGEIEITLNKNRDISYYKKSLKTIEYEAMQIQDIVDNLLILTKYTKENIQQTFQTICLDSLLLDIINQYNIQLKNKNIKLHLKEFESIEIMANLHLLTTIISNLIDNAIKYTNSNKNIFVSLFKKQKVHFVIQDEGIGITKSDLLRITDRFYRTDESRNKKIKGSGLGLSIVKNSVELHNGTINIQSKKDIGTTIEIIL
jgi:signal transduction histidine kinase